MTSALSIIQNFVQQIDSSINIDFYSDFCVDIQNKIIYIETVEHQKSEELIQNFVFEQFEIQIDPFLIGILHEIGHIITYNKQIDNERSALYSLLAIGYDEEYFEEYSNLYFRIPAEYKATEWAVNYYKQNKELCDNFLNELYSDN